MKDKDKNKLVFTTAGAWLGFIAYLVLIIVLLVVFLLDNP